MAEVERAMRPEGTKALATMNQKKKLVVEDNSSQAEENKIGIFHPKSDHNLPPRRDATRRRDWNIVSIS